jgi:hypothetical protein
LTTAEWTRVLLCKQRPDNGSSGGVEGSVLIVWRAHELLHV